MLLIALSLQIQISNAQDSTQNSVLWRIKSVDSKNESYLFGTLHGICTNHIKLKSKVLNILNQANTLVFECNYSGYDPYKSERINIFIPIPIADFIIGLPIFSIPRDVSTNDFLPNTDVLKEIMEEEKYNFVNQFFKDSLHVKKGVKPYQRFKPIITQFVVENSMNGCPIGSYEEYVGHKMANIIYKYKGLETKDEHSLVLHKYKSDWEIAENLYSISKNYSKIKSEYKKNYVESIKQYDLENLNYFISNPDDEQDKVFVIDRNLSWMPKITKLIKNSNTVIAVGVGHLAGEYGLINLLKKSGYILEPIF